MAQPLLLDKYERGEFMVWSKNFDLNKFLVMMVAIVGLMSSSFFKTQNGVQSFSSEEKVISSVSLEDTLKHNCKNKYHLLGHKNSTFKLR